MNPDPVEVVLKFEQAINSRNPAAIVALVTADSVFIDSLGARVQGAARLRTAWESYFRMVPDYSISHSEILNRGDVVAVFGSARGTFSQDGQIREENSWQTPAAWRALIHDDKVAEWRVYADNEPIRAIMRRKPQKR